MTNNSNTTELYFVRHAESVKNTQRYLVGGRSNETQLTERGVEQATRLGQLLLAKKILPTRVFVSPATRTIATARYSLAEMQLNMQPHIQYEIQELAQGAGEGKLRAEVFTEDVLQQITEQGKDFKLEGGESMNDVGLRMKNWMDKTVAGNGSQVPERYFVYTHGGAIKYLASHILGWAHRQTYETEIDNTSVSLITVQDSDYRVEYLNRNAENL